MLDYSLPFKITPHLEKLAKKSQAIRKQFYPSKKELKSEGKSRDPLKEEQRSPVKGLIHRYQNRALIRLDLEFPRHAHPARLRVWNGHLNRQ